MHEHAQDKQLHSFGLACTWSSLIFSPKASGSSKLLTLPCTLAVGEPSASDDSVLHLGSRSV